MQIPCGNGFAQHDKIYHLFIKYSPTRHTAAPKILLNVIGSLYTRPPTKIRATARNALCTIDAVLTGHPAL